MLCITEGLWKCPWAESWKSPNRLSSLGTQFSGVSGSPPSGAWKVEHTCPFKVGCGYVTCVGQRNRSGSDMSHFWVAAMLPAFAAEPSKAADVSCQPRAQSSRAQPASDRHRVRGIVFLSHRFRDCQLLDRNLSCQDWYVKSLLSQKIPVSSCWRHYPGSLMEVDLRDR